MVYELKVTLGGVWPAVWRQLRVPAEVTMAELHRILQIAMGWSDVHLHVFRVGGETIGTPGRAPDGHVTDEGRVRLVDVALVKTRFSYEYDLGDAWRHDVVVEAVVADEVSPAACVGGARACPPEDCGGPTGYARLLEALMDPAHAAHGETRAWLGDGFDAETFDAARINDLLPTTQPPPILRPAPSWTLLN